MTAYKSKLCGKPNINNTVFCTGDIVYIQNLDSRPHFNGFKAKIIGSFNSKNQRYPIQLLSNSKEKGYVKPQNLTKINPNTFITSKTKYDKNKNKPRSNVSRYFSLPIMKCKQNLLDSQLLKDIQMFKENCIYIRKFYDTQKSELIFNKLQKELNEKLQTGEISIVNNSQMVFYSKNTNNNKFKRNESNKLGINMYYNKFFSNTFAE
eukprot:29639_1